MANTSAAPISESSQGHTLEQGRDRVGDALPGRPSRPGAAFLDRTLLFNDLRSDNPLSNLTIVVVEDHDDTRRSLGMFLGRLGANVVMARNAFEGVEAVKTGRPDLVLCDIKMPEEDGFELLRKIRGLGPAAGGIVPVIAMSALVAHASARMLDAGFNAGLPKPFTPDELVEKILTVLNR
jgi:CheY-like chemotaxis protein